MNLLHHTLFLRRTHLAGAWLLIILAAGRVLALDPDKSVYQFNCQSWNRQSGFPADKINAITQTKDGYLWLATQNGLVRFDGSDFKVVPIDLPGAKGQEVKSLGHAADGGLWFAISGGEFGGYDGRKFSVVGDERWAVDALNANAVLESRSGALWGGSDVGLSRWQHDRPAETLFFETPPLVVSLAEDPVGNIWAGTLEQGLYRWSDGKLAPVANDALKQENLLALAADRNGQIWVGTSMGLFDYDTAGRLKEFASLKREVKTLLVDSHGILWIGTSGDGLVRYQNGVFTYLTKADGLASDFVTSLFEDAEGSLWVGTLDGLSQLSDLKFPIYSSREGLNEGSVTSVSGARDGGLWLTASSGLCWFDGKTSRNYTNLPNSSNIYLKLGFQARNGDVYMVDGSKAIDVLSGGTITCLFTNTVWTDAFGEDAESILVGKGGDLFRIKDGQLTPYAYENGKAPHYYWINNLFVARDGAIWVASNNGIYQLRNGHINHWLAEPVKCVFEDEYGSIWAGLANGIARIKNGQLKLIGQADGIFDDRIYGIVPDDYGCLWFNSGKGIFRATRQDLNAFADGKATAVECKSFAGLESVKFTDRVDQEASGCKTGDGRIWFPNPKGVVMIDPGHYFINQIAPRVFIQQILVNGKELKNRDHAVFHADDKRVEFLVTALSYISPKKMQVQYQLLGFDPAWIDAGTGRDALYTNLKPGTYTFRVRACNADGIWNDSGDSFNLELPPPFYETVWFNSLCVVAIGMILLAVYRWKVWNIENRQRKLQAENDLLEAKVAGRTAELAIANKSLQSEIDGHKLTELELKRGKQALEAEIEERERMQSEVERIHRELLETSRMAGMAEVATGVIHNVGNVLNSVNVSATLLAEHLNTSKVGSVGRVAALFEEHADHLADFIANDCKGRRLPAYLAELAVHLTGEQALALEELQALQKNVGHIKDIVTMQQSYAKVAGVTQSINVSELVDDALHMNESALVRHHVQVVREYDSSAPEAVVDKHKVMQILINLIRNAKYACDEGGQEPKRLTLRIQNGDGRLKISVTDNGIGIPPENLNRIFNHGFTTRKDGHGFGLHSGALAANEMGGTLTVHSDGPGNGAKFTLELPLRPPTKS